MSLANPQATFERALPDLLAAVVAGQLAAAAGAAEFVAASVIEDGLTPDPVAAVPARRFAGITSDGRAIDGLLAQPLIHALYLRTRGADDATALLGGRLSLVTMVRTEIFDTGRDATHVAGALDRNVTGYVRQVRTPSCGRCVVLAGKYFRRNEGFLRHPRCDCSHRMVTSVRRGGDQDPRDLFNAMTVAQQDQAFGRDNAEVIRRGGDIGHVVNARRGMASAGSNWTTEGTTVRGQAGRQLAASSGQVRGTGRYSTATAPRPSPGALLRFASDPDEFALALDRAGYL